MGVLPADRPFEELFEQHQSALARYCRTLVRDEHDARDVLQNVAVRALLAFRRGDRPERERAWLYRIAHNEAISLFRARWQVGQLDERLVDPAPEPSRVVVSRERLSELARDVRALSPQARQILLMSSVGGLDRNVIASELGLSPGAVSQSLLESRAALRIDGAAHELSCDVVRAALAEADGRRRRGRTVRTHLRGCSECRDWERRRRTGLGAILPVPIGTLVRWIQPAAGADPVTVAIATRPSAMGVSRALALAVSLAAGAPAITGVPHPRPREAPARPAVRARASASPVAASRAGPVSATQGVALTTASRLHGAASARSRSAVLPSSTRTSSMPVAPARRSPAEPEHPNPAPSRPTAVETGGPRGEPPNPLAPKSSSQPDSAGYRPGATSFSERQPAQANGYAAAPDIPDGSRG